MKGDGVRPIFRRVKVFLTGGTGYVGAHLTRALVARGHHVTLLARDPRKIPSFVGAEGITLVKGDLRDRDALSASLPGHDALIHNALVWDDEPTELLLVDPRAAIGVFLTAQRAGLRRLLYTSSTAVHHPFRAVMTADDALRPGDFYGVSKAAGELALWAVAQAHDLSATVIRPGPVVGAPASADAPFKSDRRFEDFLRKARRGERIVVAQNDGRQFIGAADLAEVYAAALAADARREVFLAVSQDLVTWEEIAREVVHQVGSGEVVVEDTGLAPSPFLFDTRKLERTFGLAFTARAALTEHIARLARITPRAESA